MRCSTALCALLLLIANAHPTVSADEKTKKTTKKQLASLVRDLDHDKYQRRVNAVKKLVAVGRPAIEPVAKVAMNGGFEASSRALLVLGTLLQSTDSKTSKAAEAALRKVADSKNPSASKTATFLLRGPNRLRLMAKLAAEVQLSRISGKQKERVPLLKNARYRFSDPSRTHLDGTFWIWANKGRPAAFAELWTNRGSETVWYYGLASVSQSPLSAEIGADPPWQPAKTNAEFTQFKTASKPAADSTNRLKQLKELAARFKSHEIGDPKRKKYPLKLRADPVYRYSDAKAGLIDGCVFVVCHAGNPEIVLLVEAVKSKNKSVAWQYGLLRVSSAELHVQLDGNEVWMRRGAVPVAGKPNAPYRIRRRVVAPKK